MATVGEKRKVTGFRWVTHHFVAKELARRYPNREAVVDYRRNKRFTWRELWLRSNRVANALTDLGVKKGDRVGYFCYDREEEMHFYYGVSKIGAIMVPLQWRLTPENHKRVIKHSGMEVLLCDDVHAADLNSIRSDITPQVKHFVCFGDKCPQNMLNFEGLLAKASDKDPDVEVYDDDYFSLLYTTGTTGEPKGVLRTQSSSFGWMFDFMFLCSRVNCETRALCGWMGTHQGGTAMFLGTLDRGGCVVTTDLFEPRMFWEVIDKEKITFLSVAPPMTYMMVELIEKDKELQKLDRSTVTDVALEGPWQEEVRHMMKKWFPNARITKGYSSTEALFAHSEPDSEEETLKGLNCHNGTGAWGTELRILDEQGNQLPDGKTGIAWTRGITAADGYYNNPEANRKSTMPGGWITSMDMGYIDPETHYFYFMDRTGDMIKSGGENVSGAEVELVVKSHPKVKECAVVGLPDPKWIERVCAVVQLKPGESMAPEEVTEFCRGKLASFKLPRKVVFVSEFPIIGGSKIDKAALRKRYTEQKQS